MNKSLEQRTRPEFYDKLVAIWRSLGMPEESIAKNVDKHIKEAKDLCEGRCPKCGAPSVRYVDYQRQQGTSEMPGAWVQYRCSTQPPIGTPRTPDICAFMVDFVEGDAAS